MAQANGEESKSGGRVRGLWIWASLQLHQRHFQETQVTLNMYNLERFSNYFLMIITKSITG